MCLNFESLKLSNCKIVSEDSRNDDVESEDSRNDDVEEKRVTFHDHEESKIEFIFRNGKLSEMCDGEVVKDPVKCVRLDRTSRTVHDGDEIMKLKSAKEMTRVFRWLKNVVEKSSKSTCKIICEESRPVISGKSKKSVSKKSVSKKPVSKKKTCVFIDDEGSEIEFAVVKGHLEERCDGERVIASIETLKLNRKLCIIHDGEESIPVPQKDVERVFDFLESLDLSNCAVVQEDNSDDEDIPPVEFDEDDLMEETSQTNYPSELELYQRPSGVWVTRLHKDENGKGKTTRLGVYKSKDTALKKWHDVVHTSGYFTCYRV